MTQRERRMADRSHRASYCAQRDLLVRLYRTGWLDYDAMAGWVLSLRRELDLQLQAVWEDGSWVAVWPEIPTSPSERIGDGP